MTGREERREREKVEGGREVSLLNSQFWRVEGMVQARSGCWSRS